MSEKIQSVEDQLDNIAEKNVPSSEVFDILSEPITNNILQDQQALEERIKKSTQEIIELHRDRLPLPVEVEYVTEKFDGSTGHFLMQGEEKGVMKIRIAIPAEGETINPVMYPFIMHHELSHIYNTDYEQLRKNRLTPEQRAELNIIDKDNTFYNPNIETGIIELVTDLTAFQMQKFSPQSWVSFMTFIEFFLDRTDTFHSKRRAIRECLRFKSIIHVLKDRYPPTPYTTSLIQRMDALYAYLYNPPYEDQQFDPVQKKHMDNLSVYMEEVATKFLNYEV